jgi:hypothetical protein
MTVEQRKVFQQFTSRNDLPSKQFREAYVICGRRSGKSLIAALIAVFLAIFRDYSDVLQAGEVGEVQILAADRKQARVIFGYVSAFLKIPLLKNMVVDRLKETIALNNNIRIVIRTSSYKSIRGFTVVACVCDEISFWEDADSSNPAEAVLAAIRPAMSTIPEPLLIAISSPYSRRGVLWDAFREHYGKESKILVWKAPSNAMNLTLDQETIDEAYARDPSAARAEFGAEFREDVEDIFSQEMLEARIIPGRKELPPDPEKSYYAFVDPSGGKGDSMTLGISHVARDKAVLDLLREVQPPFSPEMVAGEFAQILRAYRLSEVTGDAYAGEWPREQFAKFGITYRVGTENRSEVYLRLLPALMSNQVELLDHPRMVQQLVGLERRTARSGKDTIDHPQGSHDDVANAAAGVLALVLATNNLGVLGYIELLKKKALGIAAGVLDKFGARREVVIPASTEVVSSNPTQTRVDNFGLSKPANLACPVCKNTCTVRQGAPGLVHCNQCGVDFDAAGEVLQRPTEIVVGVNCCGNPLRQVVANEVKCGNCGRQSGRDPREPALLGVSRKQYFARLGFAIKAPRNNKNTYGRFG